MSLFELPPEILIHTFSYVGSSYFRSDLSRLTVCKEWSKFALAVCFKDVNLTQKKLQRLMASPSIETSLPLIKDHVENLDIHLRGFEGWDMISVPILGITNLNASQGMIWTGTHGHALRTAWTSELNKNLYYVANVIKQSRKLRFLRLRTTSELHPQAHILPRREYLYFSPIHALLSTSHLTCLELDLCGTQPIWRQVQQHHDGFHVCTAVAALLGTLQRLRLRMRTICAEVLQCRLPSTNLRLREVLVNLSLTNESPLVTWAGHSRCCGVAPDDVHRLKADIEKQAQALVAQMAAPKLVRILTHELPSLRMRALDVLTGTNFRLNEGAEWDDEGEVVEDEVPVEESEISDFFSDDSG